MAAVGVFEDDLVEKFIRGTGSGGQKVNKTSSCVFLQHPPSHLEVKVQRDFMAAGLPPPPTLGEEVINELRRQSQLLAKELNVVGLMNVQFAVLDGEVYITHFSLEG